MRQSSKPLARLPFDTLLNVIQRNLETQANCAMVQGNLEAVEVFEHLADNLVWLSGTLDVPLLPFQYEKAERRAADKTPDIELIAAEKHVAYLRAERERLKRHLIRPRKRKSRAKRLPIAA